METEFISYEQAVALKELGFNERTFYAYYKNSGILLAIGSGNSYDTPAPLKQQVFRWFREKYGLIGWVDGKRVYRWCIESPIPTDGQLNLSPFRTYEEAEHACIDKLIEIAKQQSK